MSVAACVAVQFHAGAQQPTPQYRIQPLTDLQGAPALALALRQLSTTGTLMQTTAHPDDEPNAMLALHARYFGMRVALVTATRGDGGQNEIGTELFDALGILRTEELLTAHRFDGAEQYFTRAVDFGYSFSPQETLEKWGRQEILGDYVRHIRTIRPDVIASMSPEGMGGGQHHQTSAMLTTDAFRAAADPTQFPEQIREGLRPWQAKKLYRPAGGFGGRGGRGGPPGQGQRGGGRGAGQPPATPTDARFATLDTNLYEPLLGCTIGEIGGIASGMHMCQGRVPMVPQPGPTAARYRLAESVLSGPRQDETSLFDGLDVSLAGLARYAGDPPPQALVSRLTNVAARVAAASRALESRGLAATIPELIAGLTDLRGLMGAIASLNLSSDAKYEIELRLRLKEEQFQHAIVLAHALRIDAVANDGLVVPSQPVSVSIVVATRGAGQLGVPSVTLSGFDGPGSCAPGNATLGTPYSCTAQLHMPRDARLTGVYWERPEDAGRATFEADAPFGLPFRPTPFRARIEMDVAGTRVVRDLPVQFRYEGPGLTGEKRMELKVVPAFAVSLSPQIAVVPIRSASVRGSSARAAEPLGRELRVTVINGAKGPATASVRLKAPAGWRVAPASVPITFTREDESTTVRFTVSPPAPSKPGEVEIAAEVSAADTGTFSTGYQVIEYPHIQRRHKLISASASVKTIDVAIAPSLSIGYIMGVGDQVPAALQQLGARVTLIDADELAWGDLSRYDAVVTGVRAYERRADLRANNHRLLKYVEGGGTAIAQYNRQEFNQAQYGPYKAIVSSDRITDENAPVKILVPGHLLFNYPNRISESDWRGWVQERGTYFLGDRDPKYVDLVEMEDPFEYNRGVKRGALVEARYGKGRWIYVGLGLWRQLPSGTDGAYRLFANLISLGKAPKPPFAVERIH
jgi:LmbE family N-acetylglucosaminyl deacetylase